MRKILWLACALALLLSGAVGCSASESAGANGDPRTATGSTATGVPGDSAGTAIGAMAGAGGSSASSFDESAPEPAFGAAGASAGPPRPSGSDADSAAMGGAPSGDPSGTTGQAAPQSGQLTAGTWDDNLNFVRFSEYRAMLLATASLPGVLPTTDTEHEAAHTLYTAQRAARETLDVALVIDTTGSMSDEISYLQVELNSISKTIATDHPDAAVRWALVAYKDVGDSYVVQSSDFVDDVAAFGTDLNALSADGGGDIPEAPDAALNAATKLTWRTTNTTSRLVFWIADAPHHSQNAKAMADAIRGAQALDVHVYPVASSGVDEITELTMRSAAQLTGGRYLFLTNDSGIGGEHKEPTIPCYFVTRLDQAMLRMVDIELTGTYHEPDASEIIRTSGEPKDGMCALQNGNAVAIF